LFVQAGQFVGHGLDALIRKRYAKRLWRG
jgi:hypothetical protein